METKLPKKMGEKLREFLSTGCHPIPDGMKVHDGTPGVILEVACGLRANSSDAPDSCGWELKVLAASGKSGLGARIINLFHKNPSPEESNSELLSVLGEVKADSQRHLHCTISTKHSPPCGLVMRIANGNVELHHPDLDFLPYWEIQDIQNLSSRKLGRLVLVRYKKIFDAGNVVGYEYFGAQLFSKFKPEAVKVLLEEGVFKAAIDLSEHHDHGSKFSISSRHLPRLYGSVTQFNGKA